MKTKVFLSLWVISFIFIFSGYAAEGEQTIESEIDKPLQSDRGSSIAPILAYEPTYGMVAGAAYFFEGETIGTGIDGYTNFDEVYQSHLRFKHEFVPQWRYRFYLVGIKGFDQYYGEGGETSPENKTRLWGARSMNDLALEYDLSNVVTLAVLATYRIRKERVHEDPTFLRRFPDEHTAAVGLDLQVDTTDDKRHPHNGFRFVTHARTAPAAFSVLDNGHDFTILEGSISVYQQILDELAPGIIAAYRAKAGNSFGEPSYMYKFRPPFRMLVKR